MGEEVDGRADHYALAATAYHLLTGAQLFPHSKPAVVISRHLNAAPPRNGDLRPDLDAHSGALERGLSKHPEERFDGCTAFARALSGRAAAPVTGRLCCRPDPKVVRNHVASHEEPAPD